jgi:hypothetical protein
MVSHNNAIQTILLYQVAGVEVYILQTSLTGSRGIKELVKRKL